MERLTGRKIIFMDGLECYELEALYGMTCGEHCCEHSTCRDCEIQKAINRLAAYENTGVVPREIAAWDKSIKRIFRDRFKERRQTLEEIPDGFDKLNTAAAMNELTEIYARIFGISCDKAAKELHNQPEGFN